MKAAQQLAFAILLIVFISTGYAGISMITDSTGSSLGLPVYLLNGTMFHDYQLPGYIIIGVGLTALVALFALWKRWSKFHMYLIVHGALLALVVIAQMIIIGEEYILQYVFLMLGMSLTILGGLLSQVKIKSHQAPAHKH